MRKMMRIRKRSIESKKNKKRGKPTQKNIFFNQKIPKGKYTTAPLFFLGKVDIFSIFFLISLIFFKRKFTGRREASFPKLLFLRK